MSALLELASKCEAAAGPDRRLDAEIACVTKFANRRPAEPNDFDGKYGYDAGNIKVETGFLMSDRYTASLDAAMTLVPEEALWSVGHVGDTSPGRFGATVMPFGPDKFGEAATPALALCAAALRARAILEGEG